MPILPLQVATNALFLILNTKVSCCGVYKEILLTYPGAFLFIGFVHFLRLFIQPCGLGKGETEQQKDIEAMC